MEKCKTVKVIALTNAVNFAVAKVERLELESGNKIVPNIKRMLGIGIAFEGCARAGVSDVSNEELGALIDNLVDYTKTVNAREKEIEVEEFVAIKTPIYIGNTKGKSKIAA